MFHICVKRAMIFTIISEISKKEWSTEVEDRSRSSLFYNFTLSLPEVADGEYTYRLSDDETVLATGLLRIGRYGAKNAVYTDNDRKPYTVYGE